MLQISAKCLNNGDLEIAIHLGNITYLSLKLVTFSLKCKIAKIKSFFKEAIKNEAKHYKLISLLPLIWKVRDKSIYDQT